MFWLVAAALAASPGTLHIETDGKILELPIPDDGRPVRWQEGAATREAVVTLAPMPSGEVMALVSVQERRGRRPPLLLTASTLTGYAGDALALSLALPTPLTIAVTASTDLTATGNLVHIFASQLPHSKRPSAHLPKPAGSLTCPPDLVVAPGSTASLLTVLFPLGATDGTWPCSVMIDGAEPTPWPLSLKVW